jgi:myxalamid-type polyketide synthase MxaB
MSPVEPEWGFELLEYLLAGAAPQAIAMAVDWPRWFETFPASLDAPFLADLAQGQVFAGSRNAGQVAVTDQLIGLSQAKERRDFLQAFLTRQLAQVLRLPPAQIEPETPFGSLGFDSLMAVEVKRNLEKQLGLVLPVSLVWNYPTVAELTGYIAGELGVSLQDDPPAAPIETRNELDALADLSEADLENMLADKLAAVNKTL